MPAGRCWPAWSGAGPPRARCSPTRAAARRRRPRERRRGAAATWLTAKELKRCRELDQLRRIDARTPAQQRRLDRLVGLLTTQRKLIWKRAQPKPRGDGQGWEYRDRRQRYHSLLARTA